MTSSKGKARTSISLSAGCYTDLKAYCEREQIAMSVLVEKLSKEFLSKSAIEDATDGRKGSVIGKSIVIGGQEWTPVIWEGDEWPSWYRTRALIFKEG